MDKPVYEIPVTGGNKSWGFPPPPAHSGPVSNANPPTDSGYGAPVYELPVVEIGRAHV